MSDRPDHDLADRARALLAAATPGPWTRPSPTSNWFTVPQPIQIDEADWGQEAQEGGAMCGYRIGTLADERAWRYADIDLIAAAPDLIAGLLAERDEYRRQLDTLRNAIGDADNLRLLARTFDLPILARIAAAVPQDPETCACGKPATGTVGGVPTCGDDR